MNTGDLIRELSHEGRPVRLTPANSVRFAWWAAPSLICVALAIADLGVRSDLASAWHSGPFLSQILLAIVLVAASAWSALVLSVPDKSSRRSIVVPAVLLISWGMLLGCSLLFADAADLGNGAHCARNTAALTVMPGVLFYLILRAAAPLQGSWVGVLSALAASSLASLAMNFVCPIDAPLHVFVWHYLPVLALSAIGGLMGRKGFARTR